MNERRRRRGGSAARRAAVASAAIVHHPEIRRGIPLMEVTNDEGIELIHDFAMRVVEQIGCDFQDEESLYYWRQTGAEIRGERVFIGRDELLELISGIPSSYVHHARNPQRSARVGDGHAVGLRLGGHVHHMGFAGSVKMGERAHARAVIRVGSLISRISKAMSDIAQSRCAENGGVCKMYRHRCACATRRRFSTQWGLAEQARRRG